MSALEDAHRLLDQLGVKPYSLTRWQRLRTVVAQAIMQEREQEGRRRAGERLMEQLRYVFRWEEAELLRIPADFSPEDDALSLTLENRRAHAWAQLDLTVDQARALAEQLFDVISEIEHPA